MRFCFSLILGLLWSGSLLALDFPGEMEAALALPQAPRAKALQQLQEALESQPALDHRAWYQRAVLYEHIGNPALAQASYWRALRMAPAHPEILHALEQHRGETMPWYWWIPPRYGEVGIALVLCLAFWLWRKKQPGAIIPVLFAGLMLMVYLWAWSELHWVSRGFLRTPQAARQGPGLSFSPKAEEWPAGMALNVISEVAGWLEVQTQTGHSGWLPEGSLEIP